MSDKDNLGKRVHASELEKKRRRGFFSKAYHRFFEGYSEVAVPKANGKGTTIERVYTADYFRQELTKQQRMLIRILFMTLFLSAVALFVSSGVQPLPINTTWYVVLFQALSLGFLFWIMVALFYYLLAKNNLTINEFRRSSLDLKRASLGASISLVLTAFTSMFFIILNPMENNLLIVFCISKNLLAGFLILGVYITEKKVKYLTIPSEHHPPEDSFKIN